MCEYCEGKKTKKSANFCGRAELRIAGDYMDVFGDGKEIRFFKSIYQPSFQINYCPMCGRKLNETGKANDKTI